MDFLLLLSVHHAALNCLRRAAFAQPSAWDLIALTRAIVRLRPSDEIRAGHSGRITRVVNGSGELLRPGFAATLSTRRRNMARLTGSSFVDSSIGS